MGEIERGNELHEGEKTTMVLPNVSFKNGLPWPPALTVRSIVRKIHSEPERG